MFTAVAHDARHAQRSRLHRPGVRPSWGLACLGLAAGTLWAASFAFAAQIPPPHELPYVGGSDTLVVLPDTGRYQPRRWHSVDAMMQWTADHIVRRRIVALLHVGDITNNNLEQAWRAARKSFDFIEGKIPYVLAAGNHDYDHTPGRLTYMNNYFKVEDLRKWPGFGDVFEEGKLENHYQWIAIQGRKWLVLSLEMGPRNAVIDWANKLLAANRAYPAIILTHAFLYYDNARYDHRRGPQRATPHGFYGEGADGEELWNRLVRKHPNVMMVICGHLASAYVGYRKDEADDGNIVHQMLVNYEKMSGGHGFLRLLEVLPDGKTVQVRTYSPVTKQVRSPITRGDPPVRDPELEEFSFELQGPTRSKPKDIPSGEVAALTRPPIHRYRFDGEGGDGAVLTDAAGDADGAIRAAGGGARLDGEGQLIIDSNDGGFAEIGPLVAGRKAVSVEVWFTPTADVYHWSPVFHFTGEDGDWMWYCFRTFNAHRAELCDGGHNERIQAKGLPVEPGKSLHLAVTYDEDGGEKGQPLLCSYLDAIRHGPMHTGITLSELRITGGQVGPFAGTFDELRVYDYALSHEQVRGSFAAGPDTLGPVTE